MAEQGEARAAPDGDFAVRIAASVGAFTKGLGAGALVWDALSLAAFLPVLIGLSVLGLPRQET